MLFEEKLDFLIEYMEKHELSEITTAFINGLKAARCLLTETDDIETMKKKLNEIYGIKNE